MLNFNFSYYLFLLLRIKIKRFYKNNINFQSKPTKCITTGSKLFIITKNPIKFIKNHIKDNYLFICVENKVIYSRKYF